MDQTREHSIIRQVLAGDREAFALLVEAYQQPLFHLSYVLTGSVDQAEDVVQETFVRMYDKLGSFRLEPGVRLSPWMYAICRHVASRQRRRAGRWVTGAGGAGEEDAPHEVAAASALEQATDQPPGAEFEEAVFRSEQGRALTAQLLKLPLELREALVLRFTEELSFKELAEVLGVTQQAAKMRVYRGLARLRDTLPDHVRSGL